MFCEIATVTCMYVCMYTSLQADWRLNVQLQYNWIQPAQRCWPSVLWQIYCRNSADTSSTYNCALQWGCHDESYRWAKSAVWNKVLPTNQAVRSWLQRCELILFRSNFKWIHLQACSRCHVCKVTHHYDRCILNNYYDDIIMIKGQNNKYMGQL